MTKRDKKDYIENLAEKAVVVTAWQELNMLYTIVKTLRAGYNSGNMPVKDETAQFCLE